MSSSGLLLGDKKEKGNKISAFTWNGEWIINMIVKRA